MAANPEAAAPVELQPCDTCGRKFNPTALERHAKVRRLRLTPYFYCFMLPVLHLDLFSLPRGLNCLHLKNKDWQLKVMMLSGMKMIG